MLHILSPFGSLPRLPSSPKRHLAFASNRRALAASLTLLGSACTRDSISHNPHQIGSAAAEAPAPGPVVVLAAGDIADCRSQGDEATAEVLDGQPLGTILLLGDNAYQDGTAREYANCYGPTWGRHKARTRPSPGNHEYHTPGARGYFDYFGPAAGPAGRGYYSFDLGDWHLVSLNSNVSMAAGSAQERWLRADLAASSKKCTLAFWHHPRFSSAKHGNNPSTQPLWQALYDAGADLVLAGHDHSYERFAPQTPGGALDRRRGIREFVVGTGGRKYYTLRSRQPNSEVFESGTWGVLKLTLDSGGYAWEFLPVAGGTFSDTGSANCVGATESPPPAGPAPIGPPPTAVPQPPPTAGTCFDAREPTVTLTGAQPAYHRSAKLPANTFIDARTATWKAPAGSGAAVKAGDGSAICWHGGKVDGTGSPTSTSWATYHDTYAFSMYGPNGIVENAYAYNVGDGVKWFEKADNWTVRRVHLRDMHDDCVETDWMKGGLIQDVLFEGCYVFLATRPRKSAGGTGAGNAVTVDRAVVWMKPTATVYSGPAPSTGPVFKVDNSSDSRSPKMVLRNVVLRVDVEPGVGNACLNPYDLVKESVKNTVVWLGSGDYPCLPLPSGWTLTRDRGVYDRAVAEWKARNPGL